MTKLRKFPQTDLYGITDSKLSLGRSNLDVVRQLLEAGVRIIQYREKEFSMLSKYRECLAIRELCLEHQACFIVNDDIGLAIAVEADGIHIGQDDLPVEKSRELVGDSMLIGLSVSTPQQVDTAIASGVVDYLGAGPIYATNTKKEATSPTGLKLVSYIIEHTRLSIVAIGGITQNNVACVVTHGVTCVAMISEIVSAHDINGTINKIREIMIKARLS